MAPTYENDNGLYVDKSTDPPTCCGYMINFDGKGVFSPDGKVQVSGEGVDTHNRLLADAEWAGMLKHGKGILYLTRDAEGVYYASDWPSVHKIRVSHVRKSWHNMAGKDGRTDVHFILDGSTWHGVNIGDNQILRVKRTKGGK